ncbi:MAG: hypothetical protein ACRC1J_02685, partial [Sandaracinobacteroides sp.]
MARSDGVGAVSFGQLLRRFGTAEAAIDALHAMGKPL